MMNHLCYELVLKGKIMGSYIVLGENLVTNGFFKAELTSNLRAPIYSLSFFDFAPDIIKLSISSNHNSLSALDTCNNSYMSLIHCNVLPPSNHINIQYWKLYFRFNLRLMEGNSFYYSLNSDELRPFSKVLQSTPLTIKK